MKAQRLAVLLTLGIALLLSSDASAIGGGCPARCEYNPDRERFRCDYYYVLDNRCSIVNQQTCWDDWCLEHVVEEESDGVLACQIKEASPRTKILSVVEIAPRT